MADTRSPEQRRKIMQSVGTVDTGAELAVRRLLFRIGYRYRLHKTGLPGRPDIVFPRKKKAIFVHGCFWHSHDCSKGRPPKSKLDYWGPKLERNRERDRQNIEDLHALGWDALVVWQCEIKDSEALAKRLVAFLSKIRSTRLVESSSFASGS
ncbi:very short patch repair endonuclease [Iodidimonas sp. SYSU 1G8]|uniref:very short patch repair endonuclease n=1 Tax=Iodidimonas sp. SYSU 1G8 TaxID=3133967 RepID=UPI0031FE600C